MSEESYTIGRAISSTFSHDLAFTSTFGKVRDNREFQANRRNGIVIDTIVWASLEMSNEAASP